MSLSRILIEPVVREALLEDLGRAGDITTDAIIPAGTRMSAAIVARKAGRLAGIDVAALVFEMLDPAVGIDVLRTDGADVAAGETVLTVDGTARAILSAERTALNFLCRLSGIATATRTLVEIVRGTGVAIACTRKTTPNLRVLEKYAVRAGGGKNHRFGLDDAVLIKDNHIAAAGGVRVAIERARAGVGHLVKIEIEVDDLAQLREVLETGGVDAVLLDNMSPAQLREAVGMAKGRLVLEASGSLTPEKLREIAETGIDVASSGWITHSAPALDFGLDFRS